jgi:hypothetical protein
MAERCAMQPAKRRWCPLDWLVLAWDGLALIILLIILLAWLDSRGGTP